MDRFESMKTFVSVVDAGGFGAASRATGLPLATVSRRVSELESLLTASLLSRSGRGVIVTEAGRAYYAECRRLLAELAEAERAATGEYAAPRGEIVVTVPIVFGRMHLIPVVVEFLAAYPEVGICLRLDDGFAHLADDRIDLAVRIGALPDSGLMAKRVADIARVVCASPDYLVRRSVPHDPADLIHHDCISGKPLALPDRWDFRVGQATRSFAISRRLAAGTAEARIEAALGGAGLARVFDYQVAAAVRQGKLVTVLDAFAPDPMPLNLIYPSARLVPLKLRAFLDFVGSRLERRLAADRG